MILTLLPVYRSQDTRPPPTRVTHGAKKSRFVLYFYLPFLMDSNKKLLHPSSIYCLDWIGQHGRILSIANLIPNNPETRSPPEKVPRVVSTAISDPASTDPAVLALQQRLLYMKPAEHSTLGGEPL